MGGEAGPLRGRHPPKRRRAATPSSDIEYPCAFAHPTWQARPGGGAKPATQAAARHQQRPAISKNQFVSRPLQQEHLGAEAWSECGEQTSVPGFHFGARHPLMKYKQDRSTGKIAIIAQDVPGRLNLTRAQPELLLHIAQQFLASGMKNKGTKIFASERMPTKQAVDKRSDFFANDLRHFFREHDMKAVVLQVKSHGIE